MTMHENFINEISEIQAKQDVDFVVACSINLYGECLRRNSKGGRVLFGPADVPKLFGMVKMLLDLQDPGHFSQAPRTVPNEDEVKAILDPFSQIAEAVDDVKKEAKEVTKERRRI